MTDEGLTADTGVSAPPTRWKRLARGVGVAGVLSVAMVVAHRPLLGGFAALFRVDDSAPSDAIVVWNEDESEPLDKAAELYKRGWAPVLLLARGLPSPIEPVESCERSRKELVQRLGVPAGAVVVVPGVAGNLHEAAQRVNEYLGRHPSRRITVVSAAQRTARARWVFRRVLKGSGVDVRAAAAANQRFDESNWYKTGIGRACYLSETVKVLYYYLVY